MKRALFFLPIILLCLNACFNQPEITAPRFIAKSGPDSLTERGIDAGADNSIFLEWEEPENAELEGIVGYYLFRGKLLNEEYNFKKIATIERENGVIFKSDEYTDFEVGLDTMYYYYLKSFNDFTTSSETSDTVQYKLAYAPSLTKPAGDITDSIPEFEFLIQKFSVDNITHFYLRLFYLGQSGYEIKLFSKMHRFDLSRTKFTFGLVSSSQHTNILYDDLWEDQGRKYLIKGNYRWKIDAISSRLGGAPEIVGSESDWMEFTIK